MADNTAPSQVTFWGAAGVVTGSMHLVQANGVNLLLADGSVRFINSDIDMTIWRALGTRAGGEIADDPL